MHETSCIIRHTQNLFHCRIYSGSYIPQFLTGKVFSWVSSAVPSNTNRAKQDLSREAKQKKESENWKAIKINPSEI